MILKQFSLNHGTGGRGIFFGGDGVIRELKFRRPLVLSLLTERRVYSPYGMHGKCNTGCLIVTGKECRLAYNYTLFFLGLT